MDSSYEEVIKFNNLKDKDEEIQKYFIPEDMTDIERITHFCKRGAPFQRKALMNNILKYITKKDVIEHFFNSVYEYIEIWDESLQINFAETIVKLFKNASEQIIFENIKNVMNILIKLCIRLISSDEKNLSSEYIYALNEICEFISARHKINVDNDTIEEAINQGGYGKDLNSKRYCIYFCACLIRINETLNNLVVNRLILLTSENEIVLKNEISYQIRYFFKELEENYIKKHLLKIVEKLLDEDDNMCVYLTFESIMLNFIKFNESNFLQNLIRKISSILNINALYSRDLQIKIIICIINYSQEGQLGNEINQSVKLFIKDKVLVKDEKLLFPKEFILNFEALTNFLENNSELPLLQDIFTFIVNYAFDGDSINNKTIRQYLYENLNIIIKSLCKFNFLKMFKSKIFSIYDDVLNNKLIIPIFISKFEDLFKLKSWVEEFVNDYLLYFRKIEDFLLKNKNWRNINTFIEAHMNSETILQQEELTAKIILFIKSLFNENNHYVHMNSMKLLAICIRYTNKSNRDDIIKFSCEIANSKVYYTRRLFFPFFETVLSQFSSNFILENGMIEIIMKFMNDNNISLYNFFKLLPKFYFIISNDSIIKNKLENKIKSLKIESKDKEMLKEVRKSQIFMAHYHDKFIYSTSFLEFSLKDRLKNDQELMIFNKETKLVQQSNSSSQITPIKKNMFDTVDDLLRKRGKIFTTKVLETLPKKSTKSLIPNNMKNGDYTKVLYNEKSSKDLRSPIVTKTYIEARDVVKFKPKDKNRGLSSRELTSNINEKLPRHPTPGSSIIIPAFNNYNSNNPKLPILKKIKK